MKTILFGILTASFALLATPATAQTIQAIYSFTNSGPTSPRNPFGDMVLGPDGNLYGTTQYGGSGSWGTMFRVTTTGGVTILANFTTSTGGVPNGRLTLGPDGSFYGTTSFTGPGGVGTIFRVTIDGVLTRLCTFSNTNGATPYGGLSLAPDGFFYGTTSSGGANGYGTLFKVTTNGVLTTLFSFDPPTGSPPTNATGARPYAGLTLAQDGCFYGTTYLGGLRSYGAVFRVTTNGTFTALASFMDTNGMGPRAALTPGPDGNLYGTTVNGGIHGDGTVFRLTTNGVLTTIVNFAFNTPAAPETSVAFGPDRNLYGTATASSSAETNGWGAVFCLTTNGTLTTLANFYYTNGVNPLAGLTLGADGYFYGTANYGGMADPSTVAGVVYRLDLGTPFTNPKPGISISRMVGGPILSITNTPGSTVRLWVTTNLSLPMSSWQVISTNIATNGFFQFTDPNTSGSSVRFYRASTP